jgi:polysaccharide lyase-like protein
MRRKLTLLAGALLAGLTLALPTSAAVWRADAEQASGLQSFAPWDSWNGGTIGAQFAVVGNPVRQGKHAYRFTVRPEDYFGSNRRTERSELLEGLKEPYLANFAEDGVRYIGFSLYLPAGWQKPESFGIVFQIKPTGCLNSPGSPPVSISLNANSASVTTRGGPRPCGVADNSKNAKARTILNGELSTRRWHDFALMVRLSSDGDGALRLLHKLDSESTYDLLIDESGIFTAWSERGKPAPPHYLRQGLYRGQSSHTNTLYTDAFAFGDSLAEVAVRGSSRLPTPRPPAPPPAGITIAQTVSSGSALSGTVNWRATVTGCEPTKVEFVVGAAVVLTEINDPFGDTVGFWNSATVPNGRYSLRVRATCPDGVFTSPTARVTVAN